VAALNLLRRRCNTAQTPKPVPWAQEKSMDRAKLLMFAALLMACASFLVLTQSVHAGYDEFFRTAQLGALGR